MPPPDHQTGEQRQHRGPSSNCRPGCQVEAVQERVRELFGEPACPKRQLNPPKTYKPLKNRFRLRHGERIPFSRLVSWPYIPSTIPYTKWPTIETEMSSSSTFKSSQPGYTVTIASSRIIAQTKPPQNAFASERNRISDPECSTVGDMERCPENADP